MITEDYGISPSTDDHVRLALAPRDIQNATFLPAAGWPPFRDPFGRGPPAPVLFAASRIAELGDLDFRATRNRAAGTDIVSSAAQVDPSEWLVMNEKGDLCSPMTLLDYAVYRLSLSPCAGSLQPWRPLGGTLGAACSRFPRAKTLRPEENAAGRKRGLAA